MSDHAIWVCGGLAFVALVCASRWVRDYAERLLADAFTPNAIRRMEESERRPGDEELCEAERWMAERLGAFAAEALRIKELPEAAPFPGMDMVLGEWL